MADTLVFPLTGYAPVPGEARLEVEILTPPKRVKRGVIGFLIWFVAAIACIGIPIAHFVLVPTCLIIAIIMFFRRLAQRRLVVKARGKCPDCGAEQDLDALGPFPVRTDLVCQSCHRPLRLVLTQPLAA